ncbi:MAG: cytochrome d ubiquinol oxidase subunit II [Desulfarculaceae bacterium]|nr:cytochrome d ubiquinol oxidase subunit II [Desulfarculaceae bacterium]MCF8071285.1 cytochrome d ubiquinol oxidase subunit II [Desulfarculaceae bacterium]MCF8101610.1 cytochrome d ubiquinol oxidase subunit II [Desulfarculaceae bacterium]MCF8117450.1 cytochrome d ubiquinol oxidase subunit II [Desulfarculaceae bacterium]
MLETIWFVLWGLLWAIYFMLDGFDLGAGTLLPFIAKDEQEKRLVYKSMGPFWDGNEVWLITAGGVTFAAFPTAYAVMFSSLYSALMLVLFALIIRGVALEYRNKVEGHGWRDGWDILLFVGSAAPALLFGVAFANIFQGIPIDTEGVYRGTLFTLLNPYGLLGGLLFLCLFCYHGAVWLAIKSFGELKERAIIFAKVLWVPLLILAVAFLVASWFATNLYANYLAIPVLWIVPAIAVVGLLATRWFLEQGALWNTWFASSAVAVGATLFGVVGLFPNLLPSSLDPKASLTIYNAASSPLTLKIMLGVALIMVPVVIAYQIWVYHTFRHEVTAEELVNGEGY